MFNKFFKFLHGYVIIAVYGKKAARLLNICLRRGMRVYGAESVDGGMKITLAARDFMNIRSAARKCRVRIKILEKHYAARFMKQHRGRMALVIGAAVCAAVCAVSAQFIWLVEINGAEKENIESVVSALDEMGLKRGALKAALPDGMTMKRKILERADGIAWAWVYIEGAKARVEVYEKTMPPAVVDKSKPCSIAAACNGIIKSMNVKEGEAVKREGEAVSAGDVIVTGRVGAYREGHAEKYILLHAIADIKAYTIHTAEDEFKLYRETRVPTGRVRKHRTIDLFGKAVKLMHRAVNFGNYDRSEKRSELNLPFFGYSGVALDTVTYSEVSVKREPIPVETALDIAKNDLEEKIAKELMPESELTDEAIEYEQTDDETIRVKLTMNFIESIGTEVEE